MLTDDEFRSFLKAFGRRVKEIRKQKKLRLLDIMASTGSYEKQWRRYEAGEGLTVQSLMKIAIALDVSLSALLDELGHWPVKSLDEISKARTDRLAALEKEAELPSDMPFAVQGAQVPITTVPATSRKRKSAK